MSATNYNDIDDYRFDDPGLARLYARVMFEIKLERLPGVEADAVRVIHGIGEPKAKDDFTAARRLGCTPAELRQRHARAREALLDRPSLAVAA